jgi:hypothetical protein
MWRISKVLKFVRTIKLPVAAETNLRDNNNILMRQA